jgi:hypothetical protein
LHPFQSDLPPADMGRVCIGWRGVTRSYPPSNHANAAWNKSKDKKTRPQEPGFEHSDTVIVVI